MSYQPLIMELTSYYDNIFYTSSSSAREQTPMQEIQNIMYSQHHQYISDIVPSSSYQYPEGHSPSPYSPYSPSSSPVTPVSPPYTPSPVSSSSFSFSQTSPTRVTRKDSKLPKIPPIEVLQQRRLAANARERKRANKINFAFNRLRKVLPGFTDREISKFEAIQLARDYIAQLSNMLEEDTNSSVAKKKLSWSLFNIVMQILVILAFYYTIKINYLPPPITFTYYFSSFCKLIR